MNSPFNLMGILDLDLSANDLPSVPDVVYKLRTLRRLNLNDNQIKELSSLSGRFFRFSSQLFSFPFP